MLSIVENTEHKDFQSRYFMFIKFVPGVKSDTSVTGKTYDHKSGITFKVEVEKAFAFAFALSQFALGKGKVYDDQFGAFTISADASKSQYGSDNAAKKFLVINYFNYQKTGKTVISVLASSNNQKISYFMSPYEATAMSDVLKYMATKCLELEIAGPGVVVRNQFTGSNTSNINESRKNQSFQPSQNQQNKSNQQQFTFQQTPNTPEPPEVNKVANDFAGFFEQDIPF
jgi:hypothetical protein